MMGMAGTASAVPILGLFTTGVDDTNALLAGGATDTHYAILETSTNAVVMTTFPASWILNDATSQWVWQFKDGTPIGSPGSHLVLTFETTFDLTGLDPSTASISGTWATDNTGLDILINGVSTGQTSSGFTSFSMFNISSGFVGGVNTLRFVVDDFGLRAGFRVGSIAGTADSVSAIPEPSTLALFATGLALLAFLGWRRRRAVQVKAA
jgi:hypothetical protein